jgi:hypothetical protein
MDTNIEEVLDKLGALITMIYERDAITLAELEEFEEVESALIHYVDEKEN